MDIPTLDPRNWSVLAGLKASTTTDQTVTMAQGKPVGVSIDILDEDHSLKFAIRRLATDEKLRTTLGTNARAPWAERFRLEGMVAGYERAIDHHALQTPGGRCRRGENGCLLHLRSSGTEHPNRW